MSLYTRTKTKHFAFNIRICISFIGLRNLLKYIERYPDASGTPHALPQHMQNYKKNNVLALKSQ